MGKGAHKKKTFNNKFAVLLCFRFVLNQLALKSPTQSLPVIAKKKSHQFLLPFHPPHQVFGPPLRLQFPLITVVNQDTIHIRSEMPLSLRLSVKKKKLEGRGRKMEILVEEKLHLHLVFLNFFKNFLKLISSKRMKQNRSAVPGSCQRS